MQDYTVSMWQRIKTYILRQEKVRQHKNDACVCVCVCEKVQKYKCQTSFFDLYHMICDIIHDKGITNYLDKLWNVIKFYLYHTSVGSPFLEAVSMTTWTWFSGSFLYNMIMSSTYKLLSTLRNNFPIEINLLYFIFEMTWITHTLNLAYLYLSRPELQNPHGTW